MEYGYTKPMLGSSINWAHPLAKGIVGCWLFNEGQGDLVNDISGNKNNGKLTNMSFPATTTSGWNPGKFGKEIRLDANNDYIIYPSNFSKALTFESHFILRSLGSGYYAIFDTGGASSSQSGYFIAISSTGKVSFWFIQQATGAYWSFQVNSNKTLSIGIYYHVLCCWNGLAGTNNVKIYINGNLDFIGNAGYKIAYQATNNLSNGIYTVSGTKYNYAPYNISFNRIWNREITPSEVQQLYISPFCFIN
jgi:Concanavalin A-like lectin/glucanases superfamily